MPRRRRRNPASPAAQIIPSDICIASVIQAGFDTLPNRSSIADPLIQSTTNCTANSKLAANQIVHLVEAWRYFAAAINAYLSHSEGVAIHQAYYAELRAVFSLYASSGMQISMPSHRYVDSNLVSKHFARGEKTHTLAWNLWNEWVATTHAQTLIQEGVRMHPSIPLSAIQAAVGGASTLSSSLKLWGFDLLTIASDHSERNVRSYEPYWCDRALTRMEASDAEFILEIWSLLQPMSDSILGFDVAYIKFLLDSFARDRQQDDPTGFNQLAWRDGIYASIETSTGVPRTDFERYMTAAPQGAALFELAEEQKTGPKNVIARALFLLRIASQAVGSSLRTYPTSSAKAWIRDWLEHAGIWDAARTQSPSEVWSDFADAASSIDISGTLSNDFLTEKNAHHIVRLIRPDACIAWGLPL